MIRACIWLCIIFILVAFATFIDPGWVPIRFIKWQHKNEFYLALRAGTPIAVLIAHCLLSAKAKKASDFILMITMGLLKGLFALGLIVILNLIGPSEWVDEELLFRHRFENQRIVLQSKPFEHKQRLVKIKTLSDSLEWLTPMDTTKLNPYKWVKE